MELPKRASKTQKLRFGAGSCKTKLLGSLGLRGLAGAAKVQQARKLSRADLEQGLWQSIAEQEASVGMDIILILCLG